VPLAHIAAFKLLTVKMLFSKSFFWALCCMGDK